MRFPSEVITGTYLGLDLGQRRDYTALAVVRTATVYLGQEKVAYNFVKRDELRVIHLARFELGYPYTDLPAALRGVIRQLDLSEPATLAVDATGPGLPVVEVIRRSGLYANVLSAMITGGSSSGTKSNNGVYSIARKELLSDLRVAIESRKLKTVPRLPLNDELRAELRTLEAESAAHSRVHDDLVFAVALALWAAKVRAPARPRAA
jgi:hypothetical protein